MKRSKLHMVHTSQQNRENSPCYTEKSASRRDMDRKGVNYRHYFPSLAFKHCRVSLENLTATP